MLAEYVTDADLRARFHQEVKISSQMEHPSIVKMYASFEENSNLYLVMEYIEGETIEQYVRQRGAIDEDESIRLISEILSALGYAHQKGFVHRDIKPSNIMIRPNGSICLLDFGIAKDMNSKGLTIGQVTIGTNGYMSPEQAGGYNIDHRSDIYSLGCVFFYMLTGHHAIEKRANDMETRMAIIENDFPQAIDYICNISANTQKILNKATNKNMMQRFQSCREFELELSNRRTMMVDDNNSISIGRGNCDIIVSNPKVSSHHADIRIEVQSGQTRYLFQDRSSNGTVVDGMRINNSEIEIYPHTHPVILLAGIAELQWNIVEEAFRKKGNFASPVIIPLNQPIPRPEPVPAASPNKNYTKRNMLIAMIVILVIVAISIGIKVGHQPIPQATIIPNEPAKPDVVSDYELKNAAEEIAKIFESASFEGFDPSESIQHYYFVPLTLDESLLIKAFNEENGDLETVTFYDTDNGVIKARQAGYAASYGACIYRWDGEIVIRPASLGKK
jgi:serine/threonine-protein kinase